MGEGFNNKKREKVMGNREKIKGEEREGREKADEPLRSKFDRQMKYIQSYDPFERD